VQLPLATSAQAATLPSIGNFKENRTVTVSLGYDFLTKKQTTTAVVRMRHRLSYIARLHLIS